MSAEEVFATKPAPLRATYVGNTWWCAGCGNALYCTWDEPTQTFIAECFGKDTCPQATLRGRLPLTELDPA